MSKTQRGNRMRPREMTPMGWFVRFMGVGLLTVAAVFFMVWAAEATVELEEGATFDGGICWEADGTEGISMLDGDCMTPADYDAIYSYENLSQHPTITECTPGNPECTVENYSSIAEVHGLTPDEEPASDRPLGEGVSQDNRTFKERVAAAHSPHMPIAD